MLLFGKRKTFEIEWLNNSVGMNGNRCIYLAFGEIGKIIKIMYMLNIQNGPLFGVN